MACLASVLQVCSVGDPRLAGPVIEEGNPGLCGMVVDTLGRPEALATIIAYRSSAPAAADTARPASDIAIDTQQTGDNGQFAFDSLPPGVYAVECRAAGKTFAYAGGIIIDGKNSTHRDTFTVTAPGSIEGVVTRNGEVGQSSNRGKGDGFIQVLIKELSRSFVTGMDGRYIFDLVPAGMYTIYFYSDDGFFTRRVDSIKVVGSAAKNVDTVKLQRIPWTNPPKPTGLLALYDTTAGIVTLWWRPAPTSDIRGYEAVRYNSAWQIDTILTTVDTMVVDTVRGLPSGKTLSYVVRTVNRAFARSYNEGPVDIVVQ